MVSIFQTVYSVRQETAGLQLLLIRESGSCRCVLQQEGRSEQSRVLNELTLGIEDP